MTIKQSREGDVLSLTLDRPEAGNRIDENTANILIEAFERADPLQGGPAVIIFNASGPDFSLGRQRPATQSSDPKDIVAEFERIQKLNDAVQRCRAVTFAAIRGRAEGAGLSLAGRCDVVIVATDAVLSFPEIPHGIPPTIVLSHYRYVLPRNLLGDLIYTGREIPGHQAVEIGLAARSVAPEMLDTTVHELAHKVAGYDKRSIALVKEFLAKTDALSPSQASALGIAMYANEMSHRLLKS
jgi:enoyl-CoA hydratase/carnithine racemase